MSEFKSEFHKIITRIENNFQKLNNKINSRYLINKKEPTSIDPTWYNLYSDGWCEQGGIITTNKNTTTINLIKPFKNNLYMPILICATFIEGAIDSRTTAFDFTNSNFKIYDAGKRSYRWKCEGYCN